MIGVRRMQHDDDAEMLRIARGARLGQAAKEDYQREVKGAETLLGLR